MLIIRSSRVLYSGCCLWYFVLWFSSCWSGVKLRVMCLVCRMLKFGSLKIGTSAFYFCLVSFLFLYFISFLVIHSFLLVIITSPAFGAANPFFCITLLSRYYSPWWTLASSKFVHPFSQFCKSFNRTYFFYGMQLLTPRLTPNLEDQVITLLSASSPLTCPAWETLPVATLLPA